MKKMFFFLVCVVSISGTMAYGQDDDSDGIDNAIEITIGTDPLDADTDNDGLLDGAEDIDQDGILDPGETNPKDSDTDDDGLSDGEEITYSLNNRLADTDGDGLTDGLEMGRATRLPGGTSEGTGVAYFGTSLLWMADANPATKTDPRDADSDNDGINDGAEDRDYDGLVDGTETNPTDADTDDDGLLDGDEDLNDNGSVDPGETNPKDSDSDDDGLTDGLEKGRSAPIPGGTSDGTYALNRVSYLGTAAGWVADANPLTTTIATDNDTDDDGLMDGTEDADHDGLVDASESDPNNPDSDGDGSLDGVDCNKLNPTIYPGAPEIPADGIDQDCNGGDICYKDADDDGYRPDASATVASVDCVCMDSGEATGSDPTGDCNDTDAAIHPGATEIPGDGIDQDCNASETCYKDADNDGYRPDASSTVASADCDCMDSGEATSSDPVGDCDDSNSTVYPGATEIPGDGIDQDCNGSEICYIDADDDGYRPDASSTVASIDCDCMDSGEAMASDPVGDCNDIDGATFPGATESCDDIDKNCDGMTHNSSTSSITETACDSYTAPDGTIYTTSGTKTAVIPNAAGCDSTIIISLTINSSSSGSITETACDSYTAPDGTIYTTSGTKTAVIPNVAGCDSTITINLTINSSSSGSITETACDSYTAPDGTIYTTSGTKTAVIPNAAGCDSTITINLTINSSSSGSITETACDSYTAPDGTIYTTSGTKTAVIPNAAGCDSTITINLTINSSSSGSITETACDSYTAPDGTIYTTSGTKTAVIPNAAGCDSTITINLTIIGSSASSITETACDSYTAPDGTIYTTSGTKTAVIPNAAGCDSTITINLTVNTVDISITQADLMITANAAGASYQWLDCNNSYVIISGEINQNFTANINGDYAVEITQNGCIDTSLCVNITGLGLGDFPLGNGILLYPNPTDGSYNIDFERELKNIQILVRDITGKLIEEYNYKNTKNINLYMGGSKGLYIIEIISPSERKVFRLVKQ